MSKKIDWSALTRQDFGKVGARIDFSPTYFGGALLAQEVLAKGGHLSHVEEEGMVNLDEKDEDGLRYSKKLEKMGGRLLHKHFTEGYYESLYIWDDGLVQVSYSSGYLKFSGVSQSEEFLAKLREDFVEDFAPPQKSGHIFAIVRHGPHLNINSIGDASIPLVSTNYTPKVIEDYRYAIKDLKTSAPSGRIVVMEGEPGTGKTHLIRALLAEVPDTMFVLVSPDMVASLAGPDLLPLLIQNKSSYAMDGPIALVLEDADRCLVTRGKDNINSIQSLLNLGDGILGSLLDLRIIATTNAKKLEMEAAILRPGRLSKRMEVGPLDFQTARGVFRRLLPEAKFPEILATESPRTSFKMTLAEAYALARKHGWEPERRDSKVKKNSNKRSSSYFDD